jgi:hypothetical protein
MQFDFLLSEMHPKQSFEEKHELQYARSLSCQHESHAIQLKIPEQPIVW